MAECIHGLDEVMCADCLALDRPGEVAYGFRVFPAAYPGRCHACDGPVEVDDPIVGVSDGEGWHLGYVHAHHREGH